MSPEELSGLMESRSLNVKRLAPMLCVSERAVYQWLQGNRKIPAPIVELIKIKMETDRANVHKVG